MSKQLSTVLLVDLKQQIIKLITNSFNLEGKSNLNSDTEQTTVNLNQQERRPRKSNFKKKRLLLSREMWRM